MAAKIFDIQTYTPKGSDIFFFDNNIWMYLFCPLGGYNQNKQKHYSNFLQSISSSRGTVFMTSMILSEFSNAYLRLDFNIWKDKENKPNASFKHEYVGTPRYKSTVFEIARNIKQIMVLCEKSPDNFNSINLNTVLGHFDYIDFNDSFYIELVKNGKWKLVTDDADFVKYTGHDLEIYTIP